MLQFMQKVHNALSQRTRNCAHLLGSRAFTSSTSDSGGSDDRSKVRAWIDTLEPIIKRKILYIQNEVGLSTFQRNYSIFNHNDHF